MRVNCSCHFSLVSLSYLMLCLCFLFFPCIPLLCFCPCFCTCFPWRALAFPCFVLPRFSACSLTFSFEWYRGIPLLTLPCFPCFSLPSVVFSRLVLCQHFIKKIALPVHLLRQVFLEAFWGVLSPVDFQRRFGSDFLLFFGSFFHHFGDRNRVGVPKMLFWNTLKILHFLMRKLIFSRFRRF